MKIYLNKDWKFFFDKDSTSFVSVDLPHTVKETPFNSFDESIYQTVSKYERELEVPSDLENKVFLLHFEGAGHRASVYINNVELCTHKCGYTAFCVDITDAVKCFAGASVILTVILDSNENLDQPPFGNVIDYMTYGGLYREVWAEVRNEVYIKSTYHHFIADKEESLESKIVIFGEVNASYSISESVADADGNEVASFDRIVSLKEDEEGKFDSVKFNLSNIKRWDVDSPYLYTVTTRLKKDGVTVDEVSESAGFRTAEFKADGFYLNSKKVKLRGANRHQSYAYFGYAMPESVQREDARILKNELGMNAVRTSHYPQSKAFIDECDRLGLLVFTEIPGWQHIGGEEWKAQAIENVKDMMIGYRNHPSIVLWGVRINESMDDDELYKKTNETAHRLAPGIFTGGVRFLKKSSLLEDVYTYNDFVYNGTTKPCSSKEEITPDVTKGYLISEYNGHMFPTKSFDDEIHRSEHALRHAAVLNEVEKYSDIAGSFAWCMFDYNTHKDFGSGDRICYHGITDMFRNPKLAAYFYKSQSDAEYVLMPTSDMNIGEYPASDIRKIYVFTNLDSIKMYKNGLFIKEFYPDKEHFAYLKHPPVLIDDFIGELLITQEGYSEKLSDRVKKLMSAVMENGMEALPLRMKLLMCRMMIFDRMTVKKGYDLYSKYVSGWGDNVKEYEFVGIKDGQEVMRVKRSPSKTVDLEVLTGSTRLKETASYDASSVRFRVLNQNGSVESYVNDPVYLEAKGSIEIMGPKTAVLRGGMGGTYVRSIKPGKGKLKIIFRDMVKEIDFIVE